MIAMKEQDEVMTIQEVADYLKVTRQTVYKLIKQGQIKSFKFGKNRRILKTEVNSFIQERTISNDQKH